MKYRTYQEGGNIFVPFIPGATGETTTSSKSSTTTDEEGKIPELDKEIIKLFQSNELLPSDMSAIITMAKNFYAYGMTASSGLGTGQYMSGMLNILQKVSEAKSNVTKQKTAVSHLEKENAFGDAALDAYGRLYVQSEEGISAITPDEYLENSDSYRPISYSELLNLRENAPGLAFNSTYLGDVASAIGVTTVEKWIEDTINEFGTKEKVGQFSANTAAQTGLLELADPNGVYKITTQSQYDNAMSALNQLLEIMPRQYRNVLMAHAAVNGQDPKTKLPEFVYNYILRNADSKLAVDYDSAASKTNGSGGSGSGDDAKNLKEYNYVEMLAAGQRPTSLPESLLITFDGSTVDLNTTAFNVGKMVKNKEEDSIGSGMLDALREDAYGLDQVATQDTVQFGDQQFSKSAQNTILYDNSTMYRVKMPYTLNEKGEYIVDWNAVELMNQINNNLDTKDYTPEMLNRMLKEYDPRLYVDKDGNISWTDTKWFITFEAYTANNYENPFDTNSKYIQKVSPDEEARLREKFETANKYGYVNPANGTKERVGRNRKQGQFIINWRNHDLYKSKVFMPVTREMAGSSEFYPAATHMDNLNTAMTAERQNEIQRQMNLGVRKTNFN